MGSKKCSGNLTEEYYGVLEFLNETSEHCFFFFDFSDQIFYFSERNIQKSLIFAKDKAFCTLEEWKSIVHPQDLPRVLAELTDLQSGRQKIHNMEYRILNREGDIIWVNSRAKSYLNKENAPVWMIGCISESISAEQADRFTGTFNMEVLKKDLEKLLEDQKNGYLLLVDIDELKSINIKRGLEFGNEILKLVAGYLEDITSGKRIYRINGDCFAVILPDADRAYVGEIYTRLQKYLQGQCTLSGGCVSLQEYMVPDAGTLFQYAETSLDCAKEQGRNMLWFFSAADYENNLTVLELKEDLYNSVQNDFAGFSLVYQPQVYTNSLQLYGAEALLRFDSPKRGRISPAEFIPLLEETGLISDVGMWVLRTALQQCKKWKSDFGDFHMSVNMSCCQLEEREVAQQVIACLHESGVAADHLTIEVTESMSLLSCMYVNEIFSVWKKAGIHISVDDFGTGYSSLGRLKELAVDEIKIDRCFVHELQDSVYNHRLIHNMIQLASSQDIEVCCEGVETVSELYALQEMRPTRVQGFLFSTPCTPEQFEALYLDRSSAAFQRREEKEKVYLGGQNQILESDFVDWTEEQIAQAILSAESDIFYVSDIDTYELCYLNAAGRKALDADDYRGKKCYKVLQGLDEPCEFCTNHLLNEDEFYIWERQNTYCARSYLLKDKLISFRGKKFRLEVALDITKSQNVSRSIRERLEFAEKVVEYTKLLANTRDYKEAVQDVLTSLGEFYQADRAYLFEPSPMDGYWTNTFEWCKDKVAPQYQNLQSVEPAAVAQWLDAFRRDQSVIIYNLDSIKKTQPTLWDVLHSQDVARLIVTPVRDGEQVIAFVGVDNPRCSIQDDSQIRVLSNFLLNRMRQERNELHLRSLMRANYSILELLNVGLWMMRFDASTEKHELIIDNTFGRIMGFSSVLGFEECYGFWYDRISSGYYHYVNDALKRMIDSWGIVQLEYVWLHPQKGEVTVRAIGVRVPDEDGKVCLKGYHRIISDIAKPKVLPNAISQAVFQYNEVQHTAFFHVGRDLLMGTKTKETNFPQVWIDEEIVHPHFASEFLHTFSGLRNKEQFRDIELLLKNHSGSYEWFKITLQHPGKGEKDLDTVIAVCEPFGAYRRLEIEHRRMRQFYRALLSETVAFAEVDLESGQLKSIGGIWRAYKQACYNKPQHFIDFIIEKLSDYMSEEDINKIKEYREASGWMKMFAQGELSRRFYFRQIIDNEMRWVELVFHLFKEDITRNVYTLIYLKDIHSQKEKEILQMEAATLDPLTGVLNRNAFEHAVVQYVNTESSEVSGALVLLDIDNFKTINDQQGHLVGDKALQFFAETLQKIFSGIGVVGRLGGDEFLVFAKDIRKEEELTPKLMEFLRTIGNHANLPLTSSMGVTFIERSEFDYKDSLRRADTALYETKKKGKNGCSYYGNGTIIRA